MNKNYKCSACAYTGSQSEVKDHIDHKKQYNQRYPNGHDSNTRVIAPSQTSSTTPSSIDAQRGVTYSQWSPQTTDQGKIKQAGQPTVTNLETTPKATSSEGVAPWEIDRQREGGTPGTLDYPDPRDEPDYNPPAAPIDTRTQAEREQEFYTTLTNAKQAAANGNPKPLQDFDSFFKITRNPDEYKKAFYADYSSSKLNAATEQEIKDWFLARDANNDGFVSLDEMGEHARKINESLVGADGILSVEEGIKYHEGRVNSIDGKLAVSGLPQATQDEIRNWHMARDLNKDGSIQQNEISAGAWNAQFDGVRDDGNITVEESINRHRTLNGMAPIDWNKVNSGDISPVATGTLSAAERSAAAVASAVPEPKPATAAEAPVSVHEATVSTGAARVAAAEETQNELQAAKERQKRERQSEEVMALKDIHKAMQEMGLGFNADGTIDFSGAAGKDPDEVAALHEKYDSLSDTEKQILAATWDPYFDKRNASEEVLAAAENISATEGGVETSGLDTSQPNQQSETGDSESRISGVTGGQSGVVASSQTNAVRTSGDIQQSDNATSSSDRPRTFTESLASRSNGSSLDSTNGETEKVYIAKGGSVTKMIQDIAVENGQQLSGREAWKIYENMKNDLAKMDNTYTMHNGHVGLSKPGEMKVSGSIVSKIRDLSSGEGTLSAARIEGANNSPSSLGSESSSLGLASGTHVRNNTSGSSGLPSMP